MNVTFQLKDATLDQLDTLSNAIENLQEPLQCSDRQMFEILLVIEELYANVMQHGKGNNIEISFVKDWDELIITVVDDGIPFDMTKQRLPDTCETLTQRVPGGLGIHLVHHYTDSIEYKRQDHRNVLVVKKTID